MELPSDPNTPQDTTTVNANCVPASLPSDPASSAYFPSAVESSGWSAFAEGPAADFFTGYKLDKMTLDDGCGNKAKFSRTKDGSIKVEYTSSVLL